jgi:hypothetical protein
MTILQFPERGHKKSRECGRILRDDDVELLREFAKSLGISLEDAVARLIRMGLKAWRPLQ